MVGVLGVVLITAGVAALILVALVGPERELPRSVKNAKGRASGHAGCFRCEDTFDWKPEHVTWYGEEGFSSNVGCMALCEECWESLSPEERLPYYEALIALWDDEEVNRHQTYLGALGVRPRDERIREAVLAGK